LDEPGEAPERGEDAGRLVVLATRDRAGWWTEVPERGISCRAPSLYSLDRRVRDLIGTLHVEYRFRTGDVVLDRLITAARTARCAAQVSEDRARRLREEVLLRAAGTSVRDMGILLDLSYQRIQQLMQKLEH
jgi:hypothetical protein